jgi:hypothetical protein
MQPFDILVLAVATWYIAHVITRTDGPYGVFRKLRKEMPMGGLLTCITCASIWVALIFWIVWQTPIGAVVYPFTIAGAGLMFGAFSGASHHV